MVFSSQNKKLIEKREFFTFFSFSSATEPRDCRAGQLFALYL